MADAGGPGSSRWPTPRRRTPSPRAPRGPGACRTEPEGRVIGRIRWTLQPTPAVAAVDVGVASLAGCTDPAALHEPGAVLRHVHPDDAGAVVRQLLGPPDETPVVVRWRLPDGERSVRQHAVHTTDPDGRTIAVTVTLSTVERATTVSDALVHAAFRAAPAGLAVLARTTGQVIEANRAFADLAGRDAGSLQGAALHEVLHGPAEQVEPLLEVIRGRASRARVEVQVGGRWALADAAADGEFVVLHVVDITERRRAEADLARAALHDTLTSLPNRRLLQDRLTQALARSGRSGEGIAVLFVDLDDFKAVNDGRGHEAGDAVLREVARRLHHAVRSSDTVARLGGDEFVVVVSPLDHDRHAHLLADRIVDLVAEPVMLPGGEVRVGASVGVLVVPRGGGDAAEVIGAADRAMYAAKAGGKGRWELVHLDDRG